MALRLSNEIFLTSSSRASVSNGSQARQQDVFLSCEASGATMPTGLRTRFAWKVFQIHHNREIITGLGRDNILSIFTVQDILGAVLDQILVASYLERDKYLRLGLWSGNVEDNTVKVGDGLIDRDGRRAGGDDNMVLDRGFQGTRVTVGSSLLVMPSQLLV